jgi:hypothetical protein
MSCAKLLILSPILLLSVTQAWCAGEPHPRRGPSERIRVSVRHAPSGWKTTTHTVAQFSGASTDYQGIALQGRTIVIGSPGASVNGTIEGAGLVY